MVSGWLSGGLACWVLAAAIILAPQTAISDVGRVPIDPASIYVLAIGTCPPWRDKIKVCAPSVAQFVETAEKTMGISPDRITTLIDEDATAPAVRATFSKLRETLPRGSTLIVYYIGHGMLVPAGSGSEDEAEEAFILWSTSAPFAAIQAVHSGIWMTDSELSRLVDELPAKDILIILDTCEASGAGGEIAPKSAQLARQEITLIASARAHEIAFADLTSAAFTRNFLEAIRSGASTIHDAFLTAQKETSAEATLRCEAAVTSGSLDEACTPQDPELIDPAGLAKRIRLSAE